MAEIVNGAIDWDFLSSDGYFNMQDEIYMQQKLINTQLAVQVYEYNNNFIPAQGTSYMDVGDEWYGGSSFAYIPTELQIASAIALANRNFPTEGPNYYEDPGMANLVNGLYQNAAQFWKEIARANGTGW